MPSDVPGGLGEGKSRTPDDETYELLPDDEEIIEDALQSAEALILYDLLQSQSSQDFIMSALHKIKKLEPVFYT